MSRQGLVRWTPPCVLIAAVAFSACASHQAKKATVPPTAEAAPAAQQPDAALPKPALDAHAERAGKGKRLWGTVESIDPASNKLTLKSSTGVLHELVVADGAPITRGGNNSKIELGDVKQGDKVTVHLDGTTAVDVHVNVITGK